MKFNEFKPIISEIKKGQKDSNGVSKCWPGYHAAGTKKGKNGGRVRNCVPNESVEEAANAAQQAAIAINMKKHGKKPKNIKEALGREHEDRFKLDHAISSHEDDTEEYGMADDNKEHAGKLKSIARKKEREEKDKEKQVSETKFNSKQEVIDHFVKQGKSAASGAAAWERGWRGHSKKKELRPPVRNYHDDLDDKRFQYDNEDDRDYDAEAEYHQHHGYHPDRPDDWKMEEGWFDSKPKVDWNKRAKELFAQGLNEQQVQQQLIKEGCPPNQAPVYVQAGQMNEDWQKVNKHDNTDGMSSKAVKAYRRENPGSKLKTAVTTKPSKLKKGSKSAKRRKSFCARMSGMKKAHASAKTKRDPDSPINKALRRWNCESVEDLEKMYEDAFGTFPKRNKRPGSRPDRGHEPMQRYKMHLSPDGVMTNMDPEDDDYKINYGPDGAVAADRKSRGVDVKTGSKKVKETFTMEGYTEEDLIGPISICEFCGRHDHNSLDESGKAARSLCLSSKPDSELGASQLASCKSQGLRAREGDKSHKIGKTRKEVGGKRIKGKKYGGPLPDWS